MFFTGARRIGYQSMVAKGYEDMVFAARTWARFVSTSQANAPSS